jgi:hypothetical protein
MTTETTPGPKPIMRNIAAVVVGIVIGSIVNGGLVAVGPAIFPLPEGAEPTENTMQAAIDALKANIHRYSTGSLLMPIIAHAAGTLAGAFAAAKIAGSRHFGLAMTIGVFFLVGGTVMCWLLPAPVWVEATDLLLAYVPMAWLGWKLSGKATPA